MSGSSKFSEIVEAKGRTGNEPLNKAPFRSKSHFTKRRKLYRMLPICEKANRIYGVI